MSPEMTIPIALTAAEWNAVLAMIQEGPYRLAAPLIAAIQKQATAFAADPDRAAPDTPPPPPAVKPNGVDHAPN